MEKHRARTWKFGFFLLPCFALSSEAKPAALSLVLPSIEFRETPLAEAIEYLRARSVELDPAKSGNNFVIDPEVDLTTTVTLQLSDVSIGVAVICLAEQCDLDYLVEPHACRIVPLGEGTLAKTALDRRDQMTPSPQADRAKQLPLAAIEFVDAPVRDVLDYLSERSRDGTGEGLNLVVNHQVDPLLPVTLKVENATAAELLVMLAKLTGVEIRLQPYAILIEPPGSRMRAKARTAALTKARKTGVRPRRGGGGYLLGSYPDDPRSPVQPDYVHSNHPVVGKRTNALNNVYKWVGGKWTFVRYGGTAETSGGSLLPRQPETR